MLEKTNNINLKRSKTSINPISNVWVESILPVILILIFCVFIPFGIKAQNKTDWSKGMNTGQHVSSLSSLEKEILIELNKVRSNPADYAEKYLTPLAASYEGKKFTYPGQLPVITDEGKKALDECIRSMKKTEQAGILTPEEGLSQAARDHVDDQMNNGGIGHIGSNGLNPIERIEKYGEWNISVAENISYGSKEARQIVIDLLIDDGVPDRGHRLNIFNPQFKFIGIATGTHPTYGFMCVMDFAGDFKTFNNNMNQEK